ncbi:hypothetical protein [Enterovibrio norvegicus]|uniref:hypothetical protein n=1 Tax=Enterovibrio norvegicus TaxID=188144 RepID=UPI0010BE92B6|nr:hypothetical protein [Enterovibrio norvegicus]TKF32242.1 hypothetical protein FCV83_14005 [Enterovibrio norvegicus]
MIEGKSLGYFHEPKTLANVFDYKGVARLGLDVAKKLLSDGKATVSHVVVLEPDKIENWRSVESAYPNISTERFDHVKNFVKPEFAVSAYASIKQIDDWRGSIERNLPPKKKRSAEESREAANKLLQVISGKKRQVIASRSIYLHAHQLRFDLVSVHKVFGLDTNQNALQSPPIVNTSDIEVHPLKIMISNVLIGNKDANARTIWNAIKRDHQTDAKQIDVDSLISNMNNDEIEWFGQQDTVRITKYKTFQNLLSEVRKAKS